MPEFGLYHYKVLLFEKDGGRFRRPDEFVRRALATVTTHDMPTLRGYWEGRDIDLRRALHLYPSAELAGGRACRRASATGRRCSPRCASKGCSRPRPPRPREPFTPELAQALHVYLARSNAALAALQIEDLLGMRTRSTCRARIANIRTGSAS